MVAPELLLCLAGHFAFQMIGMLAVNWYFEYKLEQNQ